MENGLFLCTDGVFQPLEGLEKYSTYFATAIFQDTDARYWVGLGDKGLATILNDKVTILKTGTLLDNTPTTTIIQDRNGVIWFATDRNGIGKMTLGKFIMHRLGPRTLVQDVPCKSGSLIYIFFSSKKMMQGTGYDSSFPLLTLYINSSIHIRKQGLCYA